MKRAAQPVESELLEAARRLARMAGQSEPVALERLSGGRNNRVFRVVTAAGPSLFLKSYFHDPRDPRERLAAEWRFLTNAWERGIRTVPEPLAADHDEHIGLYSFLCGRKLEPTEIAWNHLDLAADFLLALNSLPRNLERVPPASESCFSLGQHLETVERRVAGLSSLDVNVPQRDRIERFIQSSLLPVWHATRRRLELEIARIGHAPEIELTESEIIVSPSDFGFHNMSLTNDGRLQFTDFEYAGRDDPAKLVCDFFCQPDTPAPFVHYDRFVDKLMNGLRLDSIHKLRCSLLLDAYHVKWICIILNDFRPVGAAQRAFAKSELRERHRAEQLDKAEAKLQQISVANSTS